MEHIRRRLSVVIPVYNEEDNIEPLLNLFREQNFNVDEIIIVNDGSTDKTDERLNGAVETQSNLTAVHLKRNYGQTAALAAGFDHASGDIIVAMDGDLQNDPKDIPLLLNKLGEGYDLVSGWRQDRWKQKKWTRRFPSQVANALISKITGVHLHDYGCMLKAYRRDVLKDVRLYGEMHRFIPAFAAWQGAKVAELPVTYHERKYGTTKYNASRTFRVLLDLLTVKFITHYATKPMHFFGRAGFYSFIISGLATTLAFYWKFIGRASLIETPLPLFSALFFIVGVQFFLMGLVAEMMTRNYYETSGRPIYNIKRVVKTNDSSE